MKLKDCGKPKGNKKVKLYRCDNMLLMSQYPDEYFDIAIVDPPYGINTTNEVMGGRKTVERNTSQKWDNKPPPDSFFKELCRVSKNHIIWGANYFSQVWPERNFIIWDKGKTMKGRSFAECEMAVSNIKGSARIYSKSPVDVKRIHVNQKPVALYEWLLQNYADKKQRVLDTHLGSASSAIAAHFFGCKEFVGCEKDKNYFKKSVKRFNKTTAQQTLFKGFGI